MTTAEHRANGRGIVWMVIAMAAFSVEDACIKTAAHSLPAGETLLLFGTGGLLLFAGLARRSGAALFDPAVWSTVMLGRAVFELVGRLFYFLAITLTPLSSATAILQATPLVVVLGASLFFKERVGWGRWVTIAVGLLGVLIILRPVAGDFSALSLLAAIGTLGFAGRDLASRAAPAQLSTAVLGSYGFATVIVAGGLITAWQGQPLTWPNAAQYCSVLGAVAVGVFAYSALMKAMRSGAIATVTPFRYTRLLFGVTLGVVFFNERLDGPTLLGALVVIGSGLVVWWQGQNAAQRARSPRRVGESVD